MTDTSFEELYEIACKELAYSRAQRDELLAALKAIYTAVRDDAKGECWTLRKWLDKRDIFNGDIQGRVRLIQEACRYAIAKARR